MRKVTKNVVNAFIAGDAGKFDNTEIRRDAGRVSMYLFNNLIAYREAGRLFITNAGWKSNTTKERLNALPGVSIGQRRGAWYLNGVEWDGKLIEVTPAQTNEEYETQFLNS